MRILKAILTLSLSRWYGTYARFHAGLSNRTKRIDLLSTCSTQIKQTCQQTNTTHTV